MGVNKAWLSERLIRMMSDSDRAQLGRFGRTEEEVRAELEAKAERDLMKQVTAMLDLWGIVWNASRMDRRTTCRRGWPDLVFALKDATGRAVPCAIELKSQTGQLRPDQAEMLDKLAANGWRVAVIRSLDAFLQFARTCNSENSTGNV